MAVLKTYDNLFLLYESLRVLINATHTLESSKEISKRIASILQMIDNDLTTCGKLIDVKSIETLGISLAHIHTILILILGPNTTLDDLKLDLDRVKKLMPTIKDIFEKDFDPLVSEDHKFTIPDINPQ